MKLADIKIKKILYATDLSESAVHAFSYAVSLADMYGAGIVILHVLAEFPGEQFITNMIDGATWREIKKRNYDEVRDKLIGKRRDRIALGEVLRAFSREATADQALAPAELADEILIKNGTPAEVIVETATEQGCDLIVMGTHGHSVISDVLIGSTAKRVVRQSPVPVMVIRLP